MTDDEIKKLAEYNQNTFGSRSIRDAQNMPTSVVEKRTVKGLFLEMNLSDNYETRTLCQELILNKFDDLRAECEEQARLNGMGAERELALRTKLNIAISFIKEIDSRNFSFVGKSPNFKKVLSQIQISKSEWTRDE